QTEAVSGELEAAAPAMGLKLQVLKVRTSGEINAAVAALARERIDALFVPSSGLFFDRRVQLVQLASRHPLPTSYSARDFVEIDGLTSYGPKLSETFRQIGTYTGRILKGAKPADLPVVQSSKFELLINAETARLLDLAVPPQLIAIADEVIE